MVHVVVIKSCFYYGKNKSQTKTTWLIEDKIKRINIVKGKKWLWSDEEREIEALIPSFWDKYLP